MVGAGPSVRAGEDVVVVVNGLIPGKLLIMGDSTSTNSPVVLDWRVAPVLPVVVVGSGPVISSNG